MADKGYRQSDKILKPNATAKTKFNDKTQTLIDVDLKLKEAYYSKETISSRKVPALQFLIHRQCSRLGST
jgi:hypothetical protein